MFLATVPRPSVPENTLHQVLWGYFPHVPRGEPRPFVYRVDEHRVVILSRLRPSCPAAQIGDRIHAGRVLQFEVLASAANGHPRTPVMGNQKRRDWLARRMDGADITFAQIFDRPDRVFTRPGGEKITIHTFRATGTLLLRDRAAFVGAMLRGIGGRGCWGCGLLLLPEIMPEVCDGSARRHRKTA